LEKIIQVDFELPGPGISTIQRIFESRLKPILTGTPGELFDGTYWSAVFLQGVLPFLRTLRDVNRLLNALSVTYPPVCGEVNPTDFVGIETLRVFVPRVYGAIRSNPTSLVGIRAAMNAQSGGRDIAAQAIESWLQPTPNHYQRPVRRLISLMFPIVAPLLSEAAFRSANDRYERWQRRICADDLFEVYFRYSLGPDLSRSEFHDVIARASDPLTGSATLEAFATQRLPDGTTKLRRFVDMLRDALGNGREVDAAQLIRVLCRVGDFSIPQVNDEPRLVADDLNLVYAMGSLLKTLPAGDRCAVLENALDLAGVSFVTRVVTVLGRQHGRHGGQRATDEQLTILQSTEVERLEAYARNRISRSLQDRSFWRAPHLPLLIANWRLFGVGEDVVRKTVESGCEDGAVFLGLLTQLVHTRVAGGPVSGHARRFDLKFAAGVMDIDAAATRVSLVITGSFPDLSSETREALELFVHAQADPTAGENEEDE